MELNVGTPSHEKTGDDQAPQVLQEILLGLKARMVQPVIEESRKISVQLAEIKGDGEIRADEMKGRLAELMERLNALESRLQEVPVVVLAALRDAINQAGREG